MPDDANRWPLERLRIVLLHELAHVKRRDCLTHVIAQLACARLLVQPARLDGGPSRPHRARARVRRSRARLRHAGPDYAEELLEIARVMRGGRFPALLTGATLAMAHRSQLEGRLIAILDPKVPRSGVSRRPRSARGHSSRLRAAAACGTAAVDRRDSRSDCGRPVARDTPRDGDGATSRGRAFTTTTTPTDAIAAARAPLVSRVGHRAKRSRTP